ncbi:MAG: hypothetical protein ACW986_16420 [Promethearchaeota archaeon]
MISSSLAQSAEKNPVNLDNNESPVISSGLEGAENIIVTDIDRRANISRFGLLSFEDTITIKNLNSNPISSMVFCIPSSNSEDLVFLKTTGIYNNNLVYERSNLIVNDYEMIVIYFNSPLLPHQSKTVKILHIYKDIIAITIFEDQIIVFSGFVFPILPYKSDGSILAFFKLPDSGTEVEFGWGDYVAAVNTIKFDFQRLKDRHGIDYMAPYLENLGSDISTNIWFLDASYTILEMKEINREIFVSPWGIIRVYEEFLVANLGYVDVSFISLRIPQLAQGVIISDDLGEIPGSEIINTGGSYKTLDLDLTNSRSGLTRNSSISFRLEYFLPFEKFTTFNWFQESLQLDIYLSQFDFLGKKQTIKIIIDGSSDIKTVTEPPIAITNSKGNTILEYYSDFVHPTETKTILITFSIDIFDMLLRPVILVFLISLIASIYVLVNKSRKVEGESAFMERALIPINEIREFCSLYEEKNALSLEIRQAEDSAKRKKMAKKNLKNILDKNNSKIDEILQEMIPFKKILVNAGESIETVIKKLDVLEAERISIKDSLNLLESRYKRGRLPSRAAYMKLSDNFKKRQRKIDRTIDKFLQQLRNYLL